MIKSCVCVLSPPDSFIHGISQIRILEWVAISFLQGVFPTQGLNPHLLYWRVNSLPLSYQGSHNYVKNLLFLLQGS